MIACIFEHAQWKWALNDSTVRGYASPSSDAVSARAEPRSFGPLSTLRTHTKTYTPYKIVSLWETLRPLKRPWASRTVAPAAVAPAVAAFGAPVAVLVLGPERWPGLVGRGRCQHEGQGGGRVCKHVSVAYSCSRDSPQGLQV